MKKVILITGTSKGIGLQLCHHYLNMGFFVVGCSRSKSNIQHDNYIHHELDVSDEIEVIRMVRNTIKRLKKIDILVNNAGIASMNHILLTPMSTVTKIMNTNFVGTYLFVREVAKTMIKNKYGRIINFATVATPLQLEGEAIYAASKAAVDNFTKVVAKELSEFNITVNAVGPNPVKTDLIKNVSKDKMDALVNRQTIKRYGTIDDIVNVIDFFISEKSSFITGQTIYLGGIN
ncbi:MAG: SDR family NAD(P)-dependent oxidoreductase [Bacteroidales bacterium]|jgi:3-oxoacyl-[acyl-carrier protein] reductase|nr:SDR family NAD(P)-dependent oxidoreductase [Bacteroidales bacterium]